MEKIGIILDDTVDQFKCTDIYKDTPDVSLSFIHDKEMIETSSLSPKIIINAITQLYNDGYVKVMILSSSQKLSQFYERAQLAKDISHYKDVDIIDTETFGPGILYLLYCLRYWKNKNMSYQQIKKHLDIQIQNGETLVYTQNYDLAAENKKVKALYKPLIKGYLLSNTSNYQVDSMVYRHKRVNDLLYKKIKGITAFQKNITVFIYCGSEIKEAKLLQHELYTKNKNLNINLYGSLSKSLINYFKGDVIGIYVGHLEEYII